MTDCAAAADSASRTASVTRSSAACTAASWRCLASSRSRVSAASWDRSMSRRAFSSHWLACSRSASSWARICCSTPRISARVLCSMARTPCFGPPDPGTLLGHSHLSLVRTGHRTIRNCGRSAGIPRRQARAAMMRASSTGRWNPPCPYVSLRLRWPWSMASSSRPSRPGPPARMRPPSRPVRPGSRPRLRRWRPSSLRATARRCGRVPSAACDRWQPVAR